MKRLLMVPVLAAIVALALSATASAHSARSCQTPYPGTLRASHVTCATARALECYELSHESLDGPFHALHRMWVGSKYGAGIRSGSVTNLVFKSGSARVWIHFPFGVS